LKKTPARWVLQVNLAHGSLKGGNGFYDGVGKKFRELLPSLKESKLKMCPTDMRSQCRR